MISRTQAVLGLVSSGSYSSCLVISPLLMQVLKVIIFITLLCSALHTLCRAGALNATVPWVHSALCAHT